MQNTGEMFSFGILSLVRQARLAGGEGDDVSTFAPHEGKLARKKPVLCKCLLGRVYTGRERSRVFFGAPTVQSQGTFGVSAMSECPQHLCNVRGPTALLQCWAAHGVMLQCWGTHSTCQGAQPNSGAQPISGALGGSTTGPCLGDSSPGKSYCHSSGYPVSGPHSAANPAFCSPISHGLWGTRGGQGGVSRSPQGPGFFP